MPIPERTSAHIITPVLLNGTVGTSAGVFRAVRLGARPYGQHRTGGKNPVTLRISRGSSNATPNYGADIAVYGADFPNLNMIPQVATPGSTSALKECYPSSSIYMDRVVVSGGATSTISFIRITDGGYGYTSAPTIAFTGGGGASAAATAVVRNGRVVGAYITNAGTGYTSAPTIGFSGGSGSGAAAYTAIGQQVTINTKIPFSAHAPTTAGSAFWTVLLDGGQRALTYTTSMLDTDGSKGIIEPQQHLMGTTTNTGFTVATGTHPDGTTTIGVITLDIAVPNNSEVIVIRTPVKSYLAASKHLAHFSQQFAPSVMWLGTTAGASDNSEVTALVEPLAGG